MTQYNTMQDLLSDPSRWTTGELARDQNGIGIAPHDTDSINSAACWCLLGALLKIYGPHSNQYNGATYQQLLTGIMKRTNFDAVSSFNDNPNTTHDDIMDLLREVNL